MQIEQGKTRAAGLVATNSIRGGSNRVVLDSICQTMPIFEAWPDEDWFDAGTAVRVSLVCFGNPHHEEGRVSPLDRKPSIESADVGLYPWNTSASANPIYRLAGENVALIHADLTAGDGEAGMDLTDAKGMVKNVGASFQGSQKIGAFDLPGELARQWLGLPNPNGKPNCLVLKPSWNGLDVTRRPRDGWIIDFGANMSQDDAALYEAPFEYVVKRVKPERESNNREAYRKYWWRYGEPRVAMRAALAGLPRYIATPEVAKHRVFIWMDEHIMPDKKLIVVARSDDTTFGILHSRFHELWALCLGTSLEDRPRYTPTTCFETFPFPEGLTPADTAPKSEAKKSVPSEAAERALGYANVDDAAVTTLCNAPVPAVISVRSPNPAMKAS